METGRDLPIPLSVDAPNPVRDHIRTGGNAYRLQRWWSRVREGGIAMLAGSGR